MIQPLIATGAPFIIRVVLDLSSVLNGLSQAFMGAAGLVGGIVAGMVANKFKTEKNLSSVLDYGNINSSFWQ